MFFIHGILFFSHSIVKDYLSEGDDMSIRLSNYTGPETEKVRRISKILCISKYIVLVVAVVGIVAFIISTFF